MSKKAQKDAPGRLKKVSPEQIELENQLFQSYLQDPYTRPKLGPAAVAVLAHVLILGVALPTARISPPSPEVELAVPILTSPPFKPPPPKEPPPEIQLAQGLEYKTLLPTPEMTNVELQIESNPVVPVDLADFLDGGHDFLEAPAEPPPSDDIILRPWDKDVILPVLIAGSRVEPAYPPMARMARVQGKVILQAVVCKDGTVGSIEVLQTPDDKLGFAESAIEAVRQWRYRPGLQRGKPVDVLFTIVIEFKLR